MLMTEYAASLTLSDCWHSAIEAEIATLPGPYCPPDGCLLLAYVEEQPAGCVAYKRIGEDACQMKRLYVRPAFRGRGVGRQLVIEVIERARQAGYAKMRLDTTSSMEAAIALYHSMGFQDIPAYQSETEGCALFMELAL
ncbi:MAG TPA: GNAT family N-acetyltransferase [Chthonomonadaceae bacterium]|nr:GNAT family N-acetyltransferase [Chthonomonadaceae bacterium]